MGSNILMAKLPSEARDSVIENATCRDPAEVRRDWNAFDFLKSDTRASGGWGAETLTCVRELQRASGLHEFTLKEFYSRFTDELSSRHPENNNVQAKIRQQLQVLREGKILEFMGRGRYRIID